METRLKLIGGSVVRWDVIYCRSKEVYEKKRNRKEEGMEKKKEVKIEERGRKEGIMES